ncbi:hypothetical protein [Abyssicoccus albus]|uniref:Uncharacterized protein n=1 Tax=Abyssicoccus albus TaxID=1817405 RepID=A0A1Q1G1J0_9BACL|nr:hypothetical protein [Abyssicoccus albus]AQL56221.1 hypothetical protein BVH56_04475 [Abyssicoccus albus]RPF57959.1 hypothetical protein EDD62_0596 [Abyssicoccus albus]
MGLIILLSTIAVILYIFSGLLIKMFLNYVIDRKPLSLNDKQTDHIGLFIGYCERFLIILFIANDQYTAMGLIIAAKSILRFNSGQTDQDDEDIVIQKKSEYILLGTLVSLVFGVIIGLIIKYILTLL